MIFLYALAAWTILVVLVTACVRHGEQQARRARTTRHTPAQQPAWARTDRHRRHR